MGTMGYGRAHYESGEAGQKFGKRIFRPEIYEEPQYVSQEAGRNNSDAASEISTVEGVDFASNSVTIGKRELEQIIKQMTFTRFETQHLIALLHSRTIEDSPSPLLRIEPSSTSSSLKRFKHEDERDNFQVSVVTSRVVEEENASPAVLAKAYKGITSAHAPTQYLNLINNNLISLSKTSVASPQQPMTMENLPDELLSNIFVRLLSKQLAQMRSVSKSWNALLSDSSFVKSHLHRSIHNKDQILLVFYYNDYEETYPDFQPLAAYPCRSPHLELTNFIKLPVNPRPEYTYDIKVIGSFNGLICSRYGDSVIQIWNPSLSTVLTLPPYSMPSADYDPIRTYFRFGFDPKTEDYKVLKLTGLIEPSPKFGIKWWLQIEIYSMRKGTWEFITERFPSHITYISDGSYVCVDGHDGHIYLHCCIDEKMDLHTAVAFDLGSETFCEMPLPDVILSDHNRSYSLGVLSGKLCVTSQVGLDGVFEIWVMEEYGVADSWVKRHVFSQFMDGACPFGFTSLGEFLIVDDCGLVVYDPTANKQEVLEDYCPGEYSAIKIVEYVDSLVWVTPEEHEMVDKFEVERLYV